jgi:hypothetical protein
VVRGAKGLGSGMLTSAELVSFGNGVVESDILLAMHRTYVKSITETQEMKRGL